MGQGLFLIFLRFFGEERILLFFRRLKGFLKVFFFVFLRIVRDSRCKSKMERDYLSWGLSLLFFLYGWFGGLRFAFCFWENGLFFVFCKPAETA